ncbi:MAG: hypothetical protein ACOCU8_00675 [Patescibacteria group bacterium]
MIINSNNRQYQSKNSDYSKLLNQILDFNNISDSQLDIVVGVPFSRESLETVQSTLLKIQSGLKENYPSKIFLLMVIGEFYSDIEIEKIKLPQDENIKFFGLSKNENLVGKGWSLRLFVDIAKWFKFGIVFFDADVTNINQDWIVKLLEPIFFDKKSCAVIPTVYRRAYDAETTNNFAFPVLSAFYNQTPRHPLGGLRSFTRDIVEELAIFTNNISESYWFVENISGYGIDIFYTAFLLENNKKIAEPYLGFISHSSLPVVDNKYKKAIIQIIGSLFGFLEINKNHFIFPKRKINEKIKQLYNPDQETLFYLRAFKDNFVNSSNIIKKIVKPKIFIQLQNCAESSDGHIYLAVDFWAEILYDFLFHFRQTTKILEKEQILEALYPIYCLRIGSFFRELPVDAEFDEIEKIVNLNTQFFI